MNSSDAILSLLSSRIDYKPLFDLNKHRNLDQIWMLWHDEPYPVPSSFNSLHFNWTLSYRFDSEVSVGSYGIAYQLNVPMDENLYRKWIDENYRNRRNEATWFVSNCGSKERLRYYSQLKNHFSISAYGRCILNEKNTTRNCTRSSHCELNRLVTSKFYLAFESKTTRISYITEKFWRTFTHGAIPVVLGPKRQDYERIAPPNSFIYAKDYANPEALAKYLHTVATNPREYEKYHRWRRNYATQYSASVVESFRFCELCYKLNTNTDRVWYTDIHKYFLEEE
ncbi:unnamed protein product [Adineta ricciae]|uniref:Fucosyltransferase n=2 Tax=Adineta ricciae TaxID=249248 RepID=A0A814TKF4_ADIRI|nr:unnamed protein product [Adineta ricciae]